MAIRKQSLLKAYRRKKRLALMLALVSLVLLGTQTSWWLPAVGIVLLWLGHEAWLADHLFYSPREDYRYRLSLAADALDLRIEKGQLRVTGCSLGTRATIIAEVHLRSRLSGWLFDPVVRIGDDEQVFERGACGLRYLNLTGQAGALTTTGMAVVGRFCRVAPTVRLWVFEQPDPTDEALMVLAPHADDAELAAFGLYSQAKEVSIVTLTQGEIEAEQYQRYGLGKAAAARLKARLRNWDSLAIPLWGGVPQGRCVQLGYFCMQLSDMARKPDKAFGSRAADTDEIRPARQHNPCRLPGDEDGRPTWSNLVADLAACLAHFKPATVVLPHPELDPHPDHWATGHALTQAMLISDWRPRRLLLYANHLHDNDRWPMGRAHTGMALPPAMVTLPPDPPWSHVLSPQVQLDKAMALLMHHDLQSPLPLKRRVRRWVQRVLVGRRWPKIGANEYLRRAVRRHELFWVRKV